MIILGIDPGIARTGWGVIEEKGSRVTALAYGCFETSSSDAAPLRLKNIYHKIMSVIDIYHPEALSIEELFFNTNAKTAFVVGQARGVVLLASVEKNLSIDVYTPLQVKIAVSGYGRADKAQVGQMVKTLLSLPDVPKPDDTADALAIALTHAFSRKMRMQ